MLLKCFEQASCICDTCLVFLGGNSIYNLWWVTILFVDRPPALMDFMYALEGVASLYQYGVRSLGIVGISVICTDTIDYGYQVEQGFFFSIFFIFLCFSLTKIRANVMKIQQIFPSTTVPYSFFIIHYSHTDHIDPYWQWFEGSFWQWSQMCSDQAAQFMQDQACNVHTCQKTPL